MAEIKDAKLITYPRSGQNLFTGLLGQQNYSISRSHEISDFSNQSHVITIIRNPVDSVASAIAMVDFYKEFYEQEIGYSLIPSMLKEYERMYAWLLENATYVISYDDLLHNPKRTVEKFLNDLGLEWGSIEYDLGLTRDNPKNLSLVSSKNVDSYPGYLEYVKTASFVEDAKKIYAKLLLKKNQ
jgi:hypothetical protein